MRYETRKNCNRIFTFPRLKGKMKRSAHEVVDLISDDDESDKKSRFKHELHDLMAIFPNLTRDQLSSSLALHDGDVERTVEALLTISVSPEESNSISTIHDSTSHQHEDIRKIPSSEKASISRKKVHHGIHTQDLQFEIAPWQPFYLTRIEGEDHRRVIDEKYNSTSLSIRDILAVEGDNEIHSICLINYMIDLDWLIAECPILTNPNIQVLCIYGGDLQYSNKLAHIKTCKVSIKQDGTAHSKLALVYYDIGVRIAILTANFIAQDFTYLTNALFIQDFPLRYSQTQADRHDNNGFYIDLKQYLHSIKLTKTTVDHGESKGQGLGYGFRHVSVDREGEDKFKELVEMLAMFDLTAAEVVLVASAPGTHAGAELQSWGHVKLKSYLDKECEGRGRRRGRVHSLEQSNTMAPEAAEKGESFLVMQFSSLGTMGKDEKYIDEVAASMGSSSSSKGKGMDDVQLVWPTLDAVRSSLIGYGSGSSICCNFRTLHGTNPTADKLLSGFVSKMYTWTGLPSLGRGRAMPHMKCYFRYRYRPSNSTVITLDWFLLTSANLSKRAWGVLKKPLKSASKGTCAGTSKSTVGKEGEGELYVGSHECGVLFLPSKVVTKARVFSCTPHHRILGLPTVQSPSSSSPSSPSPSSLFVIDNGRETNESDNEIKFPIPFVVPPAKYRYEGADKREDVPWMWDVDFGVPDCLGNSQTSTNS